MPFTDTPDAHALTACMFCAKQIPELDLQELPCMIRSHLALICIPDYTILYRSSTLIISYPCRIKRYGVQHSEACGKRIEMAD